MKDSWILLGLSALGVCMMAAIVYMQRDSVLNGRNDFLAFYGCAVLAGSPDLYEPEALHRTSQEHAGIASPDHGCIRLPFLYAFIKPLTAFPYIVAFALWQLTGLFAVAAFVYHWPADQRLMTLFFVSISLPLLAAWMNGQDLPLILLVLALAHRRRLGGRHERAGALISLGAVKYHIFFLLPLTMLCRREWRMVRGLLAGGFLLAALSFAVGGWTWPAKYVGVATQERFSPGFGQMPNLHGLLHEVNGETVWLTLASTAVIALVCWISTRSNFSNTLSAALVGGLLVSYHAYLQDASLLLPASLYAFQQARTAALRLVSFVLLTPVPYVPLILESSWSWLTAGLSLVFIGLLGWEAWTAPATTEAA